MTDSYREFLSNIESSLKKNGFPEKRVALPRERLQQAASEQGLEFSRALELLREKQIGSDTESARVIFYQVSTEQNRKPSSLQEKAMAFAEIFKGIDPSELTALQGMNKFKLFFRLRELSKKFTPEQLAKMQEFYSGLTDTEKSEMETISKNMASPT